MTEPDLYAVEVLSPSEDDALQVVVHAERCGACGERTRYQNLDDASGLASCGCTVEGAESCAPVALQPRVLDLLERAAGQIRSGRPAGSVARCTRPARGRLYAIFEAEVGGLTLEVVEGGSAPGCLYSFYADDDQSAGCIFSAYDHAYAAIQDRDLAEDVDVPFKIAAGVFWLVVVVVLLCGAAEIVALTVPWMWSRFSS